MCVGLFEVGGGGVDKSIQTVKTFGIGQNTDF